MSRAAVKHHGIAADLIDGIKCYKRSKYFSWKLMVVDLLIIAATIVILH